MSLYIHGPNNAVIGRLFDEHVDMHKFNRELWNKAQQEKKGTGREMRQLGRSDSCATLLRHRNTRSSFKLAVHIITLQGYEYPT